jgi:outer membrane lipoprotein-sorting protein
MKKLILALAFIATVFTSCTSSDDETSSTQAATGEITGIITTNTNYAFGNYTLKGIVKIASGATVTFAAGSKITCNKVTGDNALVVLNGGKLIANGTETNPVVFTETSAVPGSWGGIIMYGDASIKAIGGITTSTSEDGNALPYGGTNDNHNGGSLSYVRVEYAGSKLADGTKELNGFSFY